MAGSGSISLYRFFVHRDVIGFLYHVVSDVALPHVRHIYSYKTSGQFEQDLIFLKQNYHPITYEELVSHRMGNTRLAPNSVIVTFDDGFRECYADARPLLLKYSIPCIFFIATDLIDNQNMLFRHKVSLCIEKVTMAEEGRREIALDELKAVSGHEFMDVGEFTQWIKSVEYSQRDIVDDVCEALGVDVRAYLGEHTPYLTIDEIKSLYADGFTIGAHSQSHPRLNQLSIEELEREIAGSCRRICEIVGKPSVPFSFPFSGFGLDREMLSAFRSSHHEVGLLFDTKGMRPDKSFIISRIWADPPLEGRVGGSDLPDLIYQAYQDVLQTKLRRLRVIKRKGS